MPAIAPVNALSPEQFHGLFFPCCGSKAWLAAMEAARPFASWQHLLTTAETIWWSLTEDDWLEAFAQHPRIGASSTDIAKNYQATASLAAKEQSGMATASRELHEKLATLNQSYDEKFGFVFLISASGKSGDQMLAQLARRLHNSRAQELKEAAGEKAKIMLLRLNKLTWLS